MGASVSYVNDEIKKIETKINERIDDIDTNIKYKEFKETVNHNFEVIGKMVPLIPSEI